MLTQLTSAAIAPMQHTIARLTLISMTRMALHYTIRRAPTRSYHQLSRPATTSSVRFRHLSTPPPTPSVTSYRSLSTSSSSSSSSSTSNPRTPHGSLFSWHKSAATPPLTPTELEPKLVALFTSIAAQQQAAATGHTHSTGSTHLSGKASPTPSSSTHLEPLPAGKSSKSHPKPTPSPAASSVPPPLSPPDSKPPSSDSTDKPDHSSSSDSTTPPPLPPGYKQQITEISHQILSALNPHAQMSTPERIRNIMIALFSCFGLAGLGVYIFSDDLKGHLSVQTADVAKRSLTSSEVQLQVNVLSAEVVRKLLNDPVIMANCLAFLQTLFAAPETRASLITLLQGTIKDPATLELLSVFASNLLKDLLNKPETTQQLTMLLRRAITEPGNEAALQVLFKNFANDEKTQMMIAELAKKAALDVLNDPHVKATAIDFIKNVTSDETVQATTGDALWNSVKHALKPSWFHVKPVHHHPHQLPTPIQEYQVEPLNPNPEGIPPPPPPPPPSVHSAAPHPLITLPVTVPPIQSNSTPATATAEPSNSTNIAVTNQPNDT